MQKIRAMRGKKGSGMKPKKRRGKGIWDNIASSLIHTGLPTVGHIAGEVLGGPAGAMVGEEFGNILGDEVGRATGRGLKNKIHTKYGALTDGVPSPVVSEISKNRVRTHGIHGRGKANQRILGGSFLSL